MRQRYVGRSGLKVSRIGLGTLTWGRDTDEHDARDQLTSFVDAGGTLVDTAVSYGDGASEELIGSLLATTVDRDSLVLSSKAGVAPGNGDRDTSRRTLLRQLDTSLRRLGVDHLDLWQVQTWVDEIPLEETLSALDHAVRTGRAAYVGVSNYAGWQTALAHTLQSAHDGHAPLVSTQVEYSLLNRDVELEVGPAADALGMGLLAWSPLGRGVLSGKYRSGTPADSRGASPHFERFVGVYLGASSRQIVEAVARAADGLQLSPTEVALAWVRDRPGVSSAILGARTAAQLKGALTADDVELPDEIVRALDDVSEHGEE
ncbi:aldo/keto reductase [Solicola gregarius]|uniref:Aldo/keto reductase n=1 Tax=Solicola gregarius TaxID=2908642 RepID=A0AA46TH23_9ACTN|nr:aldo/keto reductase [Solicola gregarius]UYM05016.1 aldo/keto reductase [Solicola gregarius]